ncbi:RNA polymerase III, second largest subunit [Trachipleistophora hominis]|uniref:DNA-directed RNA polymerase subunit beta n=1 Tax=Trachipleistophora hominis TaxID=72359 RepID=L7JUR2_TRAHO|nr:RNA polymerase III, second largest subunit [Trachipleistophora hominis]
MNLIKSFLKQNGLFRHHLTSYNHFITTDLKNILKVNNTILSDIDPSFHMKMSNIRVNKPNIIDNMVVRDVLPEECRLRDLSYLGDIVVDVEYCVCRKINVRKDVVIGKMPVMVGSILCHLGSAGEDEEMGWMKECILDGNGNIVNDNDGIVDEMKDGRIVQNETDNTVKEDIMNEKRNVAIADDTFLTEEMHGAVKDSLIEGGFTENGADSTKKRAVSGLRTKKRNETQMNSTISRDIAQMKRLFVTKRPAYRRECPLDEGAYFIIKGVERAILIQEQLSKNRIIVTNETSTVSSFTSERKSRTTVIRKNNNYFVKNNVFTEDVPLIVLLKNYGVEEHEIVSLGCSLNDLRIDVHAYLKSVCKGREGFMDEIVLPNVKREVKGFYLLTMARLIERKGTFSDLDFLGNKRFELSGSLLCLLFEDALKRFNEEIKKGIDKILSKRMRAQEFQPLSLISLNNTITNTLCRAISTGNWNIGRFRMERSGVSTALSRLSYLNTVNTLTRVVSQFEKTRKIAGPRSLHTSCFGVLCPCDTPEGESCGLVKTLSMLTEITVDVPFDEKVFLVLGVAMGNFKNKFLVFLNGCPVGSCNECIVERLVRMRRAGTIDKYVSVSRTDTFVFVSTDGGRICRPLLVNPYVNADNNELGGKAAVNSASDTNHSTRFARFLQRTVYNEYMSMHDLVHKGVVEYLDINEQCNALISLRHRYSTKHTHYELHPITMLSYSATTIPFPEHNQSPRNTYQCAMGKQSMGIACFNYKQRFDNVLFINYYVQRPVTYGDYVPEVLSGQNVMVAVMSLSGYDIEDAIVLNRNSLDRGMARVTVYKSYSVGIGRYGDGSSDVIMPFKECDGDVCQGQGVEKKRKSVKDATSNTKGRGNDDWDKNKRMNDETEEKNTEMEMYGEEERQNDKEMKNKRENYNEGARKCNHNPTNSTSSNLTMNDGIRCVGEIVKNDILINKYSPKGVFNGLFHKKLAIVDTVVITDTLIKIKMRETRTPVIGDKFSSRHGQKGVVGRIIRAVDLPFNERGIVPDLIMNPHGFPSRMTLGKIKEVVAGKVGVLLGRRMECSAYSFNEYDDKCSVADNGDDIDSDGDKYFTCNDKKTLKTIEDYCMVLQSLGYSYSGKETFYSGMTGKPIPTHVFFGPVYYQRLKHMVEDKIHARNIGKRTVLTRQPTEGRSREGGLRVGEMERDCLVGHGAAEMLRDRLLFSSDAVDVGVCDRCYVVKDRGGACCGRVVDVKMPYACKLLFVELMAMGIYPRIKIGKY